MSIPHGLTRPMNKDLIFLVLCIHSWFRASFNARKMKRRESTQVLQGHSVIVATLTVSPSVQAALLGNVSPLCLKFVVVTCRLLLHAEPLN